MLLGPYLNCGILQLTVLKERVGGEKEREGEKQHSTNKLLVINHISRRQANAL